MTTVMFVAHYDFSLCDAKGFPISSPRVDLENIDMDMPDGIYFNCKLRIPSVVADEDNTDKDADEETKEQKTPKQQKRQRKKK